MAEYINQNIYDKNIYYNKIYHHKDINNYHNKIENYIYNKCNYDDDEHVIARQVASREAAVDREAALELIEPEVAALEAAESEVVILPNEENECAVCFDAPKIMLIVPCGHKCMCNGCATQLKNGGHSCPICRGPINSILKVIDC